MKAKRNVKQILLALNEDGLGPLTFGFHIARGILKQNANVQLHVRREGLISYFQKWILKYSRQEKWQGEILAVEPVNNLIRVYKERGQVDLKATMNNLINYPQERLKYLRASTNSDYDLIIDFGVPTIAAFAAKANIPHVTIFDHSWGLTLTQLAEEYTKNYFKPKLTEEIFSLIKPALSAIKADEACTDAVYLFPPYITPPEFHQHWHHLGVPIKVFSGIFGSSAPSHAATNEASMERKFGIVANEKAVLISGGGTGVWDSLIPELIEAFLIYEWEKKLDYHLLIYATDEYLKVREQELAITHPVRPFSVNFVIPKLSDGTNSQKVKLLRFKQELIYQDIIDGMNLIISRAGGATVNDAIGRRVPLVLIPEPGQWQVERIRKALEDEGLAGQSIPFAVFTSNPKETIKEISSRVRDNAANARIRSNMEKIATEQEFWFAEEIMKLCW